MSDVYFGDMDINMIVNFLPADQIEHMAHVGTFVGVISTKMFYRRLDLMDIDRDEYRYFGEAAFYMSKSFFG